MPKTSPIRSTFNAGELSPLMDGRVDVAKYQNGCKVLQNFIPRVQGPAVRRAGTRFVAEVKNSSNKTWLARFVFNISQSFVLEFGDTYIRFFTNYGELTSGGSVYEIVSPYAVADLTDTTDGTFTLDMVQSGDVIYIAHPSYPTQKLSRLSNTNWTIAPVVFTNGPFKDTNIVKSTQVYASATTGSITLTATAPIWTANHVGEIFSLTPQDLSLIPAWYAGQEFGGNPYGTYRRSDGKTYMCTTSGTPSSGKVWRTGADTPIHTYGTVSDGPGTSIAGTTCEREGLAWQFVDTGFGYVTITGFTSSTSVTATVSGNYPLPTSVVGSANATFRWQHGALSAVEGYPSKVTFFRERLTLAMGIKLFFSVSGDFENFAAKDDAGNVVDDRAIQITIASDQTNTVQWLMPTQALLIGTAGCEFACQENTSTQAFAPGNAKIEQQTSEGSRAAKPVRVGFSTLFVQRSGRKLKEMAYSFQQNGYISSDMTVLSEHITYSGITSMAWHQEPYVCMWAARTDGQLVGFTFNKEQDVLGWHRHVLGGSYNGSNAVVESVVTIPAPDKSRDDLWMIVKRTINGTTKRYIEYLEHEYRDGDLQSSAFYVDAGLTYSGTAAKTISGLNHLEGQTVSVLANGAAHPDVVVTSGTITLQVSATVAQIGLGYISDLQTNRIEAGAGDGGTSQGKTKRITKLVVRFYNTLGAKFGPNSSMLDEIQFRSSANPMDNAPPLFTGDKLVEWPNGYDFDGYILIRQYQPLPMTVVALMPQVTTFDR